MRGALEREREEKRELEGEVEELRGEVEGVRGEMERWRRRALSAEALLKKEWEGRGRRGREDEGGA